MPYPLASSLAGLPERLRTARRAAGLTQRDAADQLETRVHPSTISDWERGDIEPRLNHVVSMWALYRVRLEWLILGRGRMR